MDPAISICPICRLGYVPRWSGMMGQWVHELNRIRPGFGEIARLVEPCKATDLLPQGVSTNTLDNDVDSSELDDIRTDDADVDNDN